MYTLKSVVQRGTLLGVAGAFVVATFAPSAAVFANALNPLTERSLFLSSSAPGYMDTDGSGNSAASPNSVGQNYAPAGSGPNGKKSGQTFTFTHSSTATGATNIKGFSLQYCTTAAGFCQAPGDNTGDARDSSRESNTDGHAKSEPTSDFEFVTSGDDGEEPPVNYTWVERTSAIPTAPGLDPLGAGNGEYQVLVNNTISTGWTLATTNLEDTAHAEALTGKDNYATLVNSAGRDINSGDVVEIRFRPSENVYITNPGSKEFFVKINTYNSATDLLGSHNHVETSEAPFTVVDGGVTVANVMTDSIHITTKVLETMSFSVGTQNRDTVDLGSGQIHGKCDPILTPNNNRLNLGNPSAEYSLETGRAWDVYSYWRLSSNSSGGASVYYSGDTLRNTVGDHIADIPEETVSTPGTEQFGLGFVNPGFGPDEWEDTKDTGDATWATNYTDPNSYPFRTLASQIGTPQFDGESENSLNPQAAANMYDEAEGTIFTPGPTVGPGTAEFRFLASSLTVPELIAQQNETVISCATAKMRYVANIGADTPAGVYTTKINYLAAPQY